MPVLVTGGAGYIGSHAVYALIDRGEQVVVIDNLSTGRRASVSEKAQFIEGELADQPLVANIIRENNIDAVLHFAGSVVVPESVINPLPYYRNNTQVALSLAETCIKEKVTHFIFSSTAAVYGLPDVRCVSEEEEKKPINPYGRSKLATEWLLEDCTNSYDFRYVALRYFNVAGADPLGRTGQSTPNATHLIKRACQVALGRYPHLDIFGTDYPTPDGTGVRDYIHVSDLIDAHLLALQSLRDGGASNIYNCGYGRGTSVREIIEALEAVTGRSVPFREQPRRAGDPPMLVANPSRLKSDLNWKPRIDDLQAIVRSALAWERQLNGI